MQAPRMIPRFLQYEPAVPPRAVVLVVHGLNLHPDRMTPVCTLLQSLGCRVVRMALAGHRGDYSALKDVTRESWLEDYRAAAGFLAGAAQDGGSPEELPVGFLGQSLGALTFCDFLLTEPLQAGGGPRAPDGPRAAVRALFLAPAIALRPSAQLLRPLAALTRRLPIPSASSPED
ncbi:MAG: hypothetical protein GVY29_12810, partial [Spirochaetes bacterium]|nr:hypothetical protein [Spirochaetota bacterium]